MYWELRMEVLEADFFTLFLKLDNLDTNNWYTILTLNKTNNNIPLI